MFTPCVKIHECPTNIDFVGLSPSFQVFLEWKLGPLGVKNSFKKNFGGRFWKAIFWLWLCMLCPWASYFISMISILDLTCKKWIERLQITFVVFFNFFNTRTISIAKGLCSFNTLLIKHYDLSILKWYSCTIFSTVIHNTSSLNLYD